MVRAKFYCNSITHEFNNGTTVVLHPVTNGSEENKNFYQWTPSGNITLNVVKRSTSESFEIGKEYYVDFKPCEEEK